MNTNDLIRRLQNDGSPLSLEAIDHLDQLRHVFMEELVINARTEQRIRRASHALNVAKAWAIEHRSAKFRVHLHDIERALLAENPDNN